MFYSIEGAQHIADCYGCRHVTVVLHAIDTAVFSQPGSERKCSISNHLTIGKGILNSGPCNLAKGDYPQTH